MLIEIYESLPANPVIAEARTLYAEAFAEPPYLEGPKQADEFVGRLRRYATERTGFRLLLARRGQQLAGLALTVRGLPGDWWRDQVAEHLGPTRTKRWLGDQVTEVVHLAVAPQLRRQRVGSALLAQVGSERAVLACHPTAVAAQRLYLGAGWRQLSDSFQPGGSEPSWLLGYRG